MCHYPHIKRSLLKVHWHERIWLARKAPMNTLRIENTHTHPNTLNTHTYAFIYVLYESI